MGRRTSQLPPSTPTLNSFFDYVDPNETDPALSDKTTTVQHIVELVIETIGTGGVTGLTYDHNIAAILAGSKSLGKWVNGDTVDSLGKTPYQVLEEAFADYLDPAVTALTSATLIKTFEVGEALPDGNSSVSYFVSNPTNIKAQPPDIGILTTNIADASFPTNPLTLLGSGGFLIDIEPDTLLTAPGTRTITLTGTNSHDASFSGTGTIYWKWKKHIGNSALTFLDNAAVLALNDAGTALTDTIAGTYAFEAGGYKYIVHEATLGTLTSFKDAATQLSVPFESPVTLAVTNDFGITANHKIYRTTNSLGGAITVIAS